MKHDTVFQHHVDGVIPSAPPAENESNLYYITNHQWQCMKSEDRVALLGTGRDLFIEDMLVSPKSQDPGQELRLRHPLDAPMEVQGNYSYFEYYCAADSV